MSQTWMSVNGACYVVSEPTLLDSEWTSCRVELGWYRKWKDRDTEEWVHERNKVTGYMYGYVAEFAIKNIRAGDLVAVQGELRRGVFREFKRGHNVIVTHMSIIAKADEGYRETHAHPMKQPKEVVD